MNVFQATILGLIQGITEFIPVSSSGHLTILPELFGWEQQSTAFDIILHAGTLLALLFFYRVKLWKYVTEFNENKKEISLIAIGSIPAIGAAGLIAVINKLTDDSLDQFIKNPFLLVFMLISVGIAFIVADKIYHDNHKKVSGLSLLDSIFIGFAQIIALLRGTSRSGITILAGQSRGYTKEDAANLSFLMGIPVMIVGFAYELLDLATNTPSDFDGSLYLVGFLTSFISGLIAIKFLLDFLKRYGLSVFGYYRIILGIIVLIILL